MYGSLLIKTPSMDLFCAILKNSLQDVKKCIDGGESINSFDVKNKKNTPLLFAVERQELLISKFLLENNADVNAINDNGDTALHIAIKKCKTNTKEMVELILKYQPNVDVSNNKRKTPIILCKEQDLVEIVQLLNDYKTSKQRDLIATGSKRKSSIEKSRSTSNKKSKNIEKGSSKNVNENSEDLASIFDQQGISSEGTKLAQHGNIYQLLLLMLVLWRAHKRGYAQFRLATELAEAEKVDDLVFQHKPIEEEEWKSRLIQVKHKESVDEKDLVKIKENDLLSTDDGEAFSLQKYFRSYVRIKRNCEENLVYSAFFKANIEDVILLTNTDFESESVRNQFEIDLGLVVDPLLNVKEAIKYNSGIYKLIDNGDNSNFVKKLKLIFNDTSDFMVLLGEIAECVTTDKQIEKTSLFKEYFYSLNSEIFKIVREKSETNMLFSDNMFDDKHVSLQSQTFATWLLKEIAFRTQCPKSIEISNDFGKIDLPSNKNKLEEIAEKLVMMAENNSELTILDFKNNHIALAAEVINVATKKFRNKFINPEKNQLNKKMLRDIFKEKLAEYKKVKKINNEVLKDVKFIISEDFGENNLPNDDDILKILANSLAHMVKNKIELKSSFSEFNVILLKEILDASGKKFRDVFVKLSDNDDTKLSLIGKKFRTIFIDEMIGEIEIKKTLNQFRDKKLKMSTAISGVFFPVKEPEIKNMSTFVKQISNLISTSKSEKIIEMNENCVAHDQRADFLDNVKLLAGHVLIKKVNKTLFSSKFILSGHLPGNLNDFREGIKTSLKSEFKFLKQYELKINFPTFKFRSCKDGELYRKLPTLLSPSDIDTFFQQFKLIVAYPNRKELTNLMNGEIENCFAEIESKDFSALYQLSMHNWMADRIGITYTPEKARKLFGNLKTDLLIREIEGVNKSYFANKNVNLTFVENNEEIEAFLKDETAQILHIISESVLISSIRVIQTLEILRKKYAQNIKKYTSKLGRIFISLHQLLDQTFCNEVIKCFEDEKRANLLVIESQISINSSDLYQNFYNVLVKRNNKKIIFLASENDKFLNNFSNLKNKFIKIKDIRYSFKDFVKNSRDELLKSKVTFQGNVLRFGTLINDEIAQEIVCAEILTKLISNTQVEIGDSLKSLGEISNYYCKRFFCPTEIVGNLKYDRNFSDRLAIDLNEAEFNELCKKYPNDNIHRLKLFTRAYFAYIWLGTRGTIKNLMKHRNTVLNLNYAHFKRDENNEGKYSEKQFFQKIASQKVVIISDIAGMGKSTLLTRMALKMKEMHPTMWVIRMDLNDHAEFFEEIKRGKIKNQSFVMSDLKETVEIICDKLLKFKTDFEKRLFRKCLETENKLVILFDGFDEISPNYAFIVMKIIQTLSGTNIYQMWITTRPHMRDELENKFEVFAYSLDSFTETNKIQFLTKYWTFKNQNLSNQLRVEMFASKLVHKISASISDKESRFTGVPLQLKMLAEIFEKKSKGLPKIIAKSFQNIQQGVLEFHNSSMEEPIFPKKLNIFSLYTLFTNHKYTQVHAKEKIKAVTVPAKKLVKKSFPQFIKRHQKLSLHTIFTSTQCEKLLPNQKLNYLAQLLKDSDEEGFIDHYVNNRPFFIHLTFAEYFAADFFANALKDNYYPNTYIHDFLLKEVLTKDNYPVIRSFFNSQLIVSELQTYAFTAIGKSISNWWPTGNLVNSAINRSVVFVNCVETNDQIVDLLLKSLSKHADLLDEVLNTTDKHGTTPLLHALLISNYKLTEILIKHGDNIDKVDITGQSAFFIAVNRCAHPEVIQLLIKSGANVHFVDSNKDSVLSIAVEYGNLKVIDMLLEQNANVNSRNGQGLAAIHHAIHSNSLEVVKRIVDEGADVNAQDETGNTALHYATCKGYFEICKWLGESRNKGGGGADLRIKANDGSTLMHEAAISGNLDLCKWLVNRGLSIFDTDESNRTPLHEAAKYGNLEVVQWLIEKGLDRNAVDGEGNSVLFEVSKYGSSELCKLLNTHLEINELNRMLHMAVRYGNMDVVEWLVHAGADVNNVEQSAEDEIPVLLQVTRDSFGEEKKFKLLKYSEAYYEKSNDGIERLGGYIAANDEEKIIKFLIRNGANVNTVDNANTTVLHWAAEYSSPKMVKWLIKNGITVNLKNAKQENAYDIAFKNGRNDVANYLQSSLL